MGLKSSGYVTRKIFTLSKSKEGNERGKNVGFNVVIQLATNFFGSHRNVTVDNFFTSMDLADNLLQNGLTLVGTVRQNKRFIPKEFLPNRNRKEHSTEFGFTNNHTLLSYVPNRNKSVVLLSTMHHTNDVIIEDSSKPEVITYYNKTKGGVDSLDQMVHTNSCKRKTRRWPLALFMNAIDVCGVAAYITFLKKNPAWNMKKIKRRRHIFLVELAENLVESHIRRRPKIGLQRSALQCMEIVVPGSHCSIPVAQRPTAATKKRCHLCDPKKGRMQKTVCHKCGKNVCAEHSTSTRKCNKCL